MLKLRYLFENFALAKEALANWEHDGDSLDDMLARFRISSNAVYPFMLRGRVCVLRLAPECEKLERNVRGELEFIEYLISRGYPAMRPLPARTGETVLVLDTRWGRWYASAFEGVAGVQIEDTDCADGIMLAYGRALGRMHALAAEYEPRVRKWDWRDALDWARGELTECGAPEIAFAELAAVRDALDALPRDAGNYGPVHYDFEPDNVFYDAATGGCNVIDFDDGMYHWYALDVEQALAELEDMLEDGERFGRAREQFMRGYRMERAFTGGMEATRPLMRRFCNIYAYARLAHCLSDHFDAEPDWLIELRGKLERRRAYLEEGMARTQNI